MRPSLDDRIVVSGAGGFIGGHLLADLIRQGYRRLRGVDIKPFDRWYQRFPEVENLKLDLREKADCFAAVRDAAAVFNFAADMGGMGFIENNKALCMLSVLINTHLLMASREAGVRRFFFSSSACVYAHDKQVDPAVEGLREEDAYPAMPEDGYGWEKLFSERMCRHFTEDLGLTTRVARYHNVYGPCFDAKTDVLTANGWKAFPALTMDDSVATLNQEIGVLEYHRPYEIQSYDYDGPMYRVDHTAGDLLITPDHSIFYATTTSGRRTRTPFRLGKVSESGWGRAAMFFSCRMGWDGQDERSVYVLEESRCSDGRSLANKGGARKEIAIGTWLRFVGWYLSEGSSWITPSNHTVSISQAPGPKQDEIAELLRDMGFRPYVNGRNVNVSSKQLYDAVQEFGSTAARKQLPRWYLMLPPHRLKDLFVTLMAGDGDADQSRYSTVSARLADAVMELALKLGKRAWIKRAGSLYRVHMCARTVIKTRRTHRTIERYRGRVYDVTVKNHVLLVRRNGKPMWSGNCGTYDGGREKAPAAICRKVATAKLAGRDEIEIWGSGEQTRSFTYIDDCVHGTQAIMASDTITFPINLGSSEKVTINQLVDIVEEIAGVRLRRRYNLAAPKGVNGRNSDNTLINKMLGWEPSVPLRLGMERTYRWIYDEIRSGRSKDAAVNQA